MCSPLTLFIALQSCAGRVQVPREKEGRSTQVRQRNASLREYQPWEKMKLTGECLLPPSRLGTSLFPAPSIQRSRIQT